MTIVVTLVNVGNNVTGPFDLYSDTDGFINAFETDVPLNDLLSGYASSNVPTGTNVLRVYDKTGVCLNSVDTPLITQP